MTVDKKALAKTKHLFYECDDYWDCQKFIEEYEAAKEPSPSTVSKEEIVGTASQRAFYDWFKSERYNGKHPRLSTLAGWQACEQHIKAEILSELMVEMVFNTIEECRAYNKGVRVTTRVVLQAIAEVL